MRGLVLTMAAAAALLVPAAPAWARDWTASSGDIAATLTVPEPVGGSSYVDPDEVRLNVTYKGSAVHGDALPRPCSECGEVMLAAITSDSDSPLAVRDLDADSIAEVLVHVFTGGAHCCSQLYLYSLAPEGSAPLAAMNFTRRSFGNAGFQIEDIDGDGRPEFRGRDERFFYEFTFYAASGAPVRIYRWEGGRWRLRTRDFRAAIAADARDWARIYRRERGGRSSDVRGILAAWAADQAMLGRWRTARAELERARRRGWLGGASGYAAGRSYIRRLERFLRRTGYIG